MSFRFQTKLTLIYLALFLGAQVFIVSVIYTQTQSAIRQDVVEQLSASARVFQRIISERVEILRTSSGVLAQDFAFREAIATDDLSTTRSALKNFSARLGTDIAMIMDLDGKSVASVSNLLLADENTFVPSNLRQDATKDRPSASLVENNGHLIQMVVVPIYAPVKIAYLVLGIEIDLDTAIEIMQLSPIDLDIAFMYRLNNDVWNLAVATANDSQIRLMLSKDQNIGRTPGQSVGKNEDEYLIWRETLNVADSNSEIAALLYYSVDTALETFRGIATLLFYIAFGGVLVLSLGSFFVARGITKPLKQLVTISQKIADGNYNEKVNITTTDSEIKDLAISFDRMVSAVKDREQHIVHQASHDPSTGLLNRLGFDRVFTPELKKKGSFSVIAARVTDSSDFQKILDFERLNELMKAVGGRIADVTGGDVARLANDIFYVVIKEGKTPDIDAIIMQLLGEFLSPFMIKGLTIDVAMRYGVVLIPEHGTDASDLMRKAAIAMDEARNTSTSYAIYNDTLDSTGAHSLSLMSDMRKALRDGIIRFAYQPKVNIKTGKVQAVEALIRWTCSRRGFVAPDDFIGLAEKTGDIALITEWAIKQATSQYAKWYSEGLDIKIAVNLSASDLLNPDLPSMIKESLAHHSMNADRLILEVTENALMRDISRAVKTLEILNAMGIILSIDDYGTGYSSLSYLKGLPVHELKIDMSFIRKLASSNDDVILVQSTIDLGHNLGLSVTAEGVEDEKSVHLLRELECDTLQGYFIQKPVPPTQIPLFVRTYKLA